MLSRSEIERAARLLAARLAGGRLDRIVQRDAVTLELLVKEPAGGGRCPLVLSCDPRHAWIGEAEAFAPAPPSPLPFAQLLRARLGRARVEDVTVAPGERQLELRLAAGAASFALVLQVLGPRSNLYLLGDDDRIVGALRSLADTRSELAAGGPLAPPASAAPPPGEDRFAALPDAEFLRAIERYYVERAGGEQAEALARRIARALTRERQRLVRREAALRGDLARRAPAEEERRVGELLKGALHTVPPGAQDVTVRDYATDQDVVIALDPRLSPGQNLARRFAAYQRARRREDATGTQLAALEAELASLEALRLAFDALAGSGAPDLDALSRFAARAEMGRLLARHPLRGQGPRPQPRERPGAGLPGRLRDKTGQALPARLRPARYRTRDGLEVWVGRSAEGNDFLTTRLARGNDLFLHVEASPGSHVVLRTAGRKDAPQESLLEASELAVHFSKQRRAPQATLHVAPIKDVRKPRGARPGLVEVQRGRSLVLRRDAARLARVLEARIEDDA